MYFENGCFKKLETLEDTDQSLDTKLNQDDINSVNRSKSARGVGGGKEFPSEEKARAR